MGDQRSPSRAAAAIRTGPERAGIPTARGTGALVRDQVMRVLARLQWRPSNKLPRAPQEGCSYWSRVFREIPTRDEARRIAVNVSRVSCGRVGATLTGSDP